MKKIVVCTSSSGLDYIDKPDNIRILPLNIAIDGKNYKDGKDISYNQISQVMTDNRSLMPVTSPPTREEAIHFFTNLVEEGYKEVFVVTLSSWMSPTYDLLYDIRSLFTNELFIHIFDTKTIAYAEATLALEASKMMSAGKSTLKIAERLHQMRAHNSFWFVIDDLKNMIKNKRISAPAGMFASMLNIKPILSINNYGEIYPADKVRKIEKAIEKMCHTAIEALEESPGQVFIMSTGNETYLPLVKNTLAQFGFSDIPVYPTPATSIANHGPYGVGLGIMHNC